MYKFTNESDAYLAGTALRVAAETFRNDARAATRVKGYAHITAQFTEQAARALALADAIEEGTNNV